MNPLPGVCTAASKATAARQLAIAKAPIAATKPATPVLLNLCTIAAAWGLAPELQARGIEPIFAMAVGVMAGGVLQLGVQIPALRRIGVVPRLAWRWSELRSSWQDSGTQNIVHLMAPALLGVSVAQISLLINTQIASHLRPGSVSWLSYADRLMEFPTAMLGVALGVAWVHLALLATALACVVGLAASGIDVFAARGLGWPA
jgi:peptidoglycan biosynthesis protein MviN/MurJ (putative lipid II flippase)